MKYPHTQDMKGKSLEKAFGLVLRQLRDNGGLSQENLGFESGYHRTYISLLERGQKSPSLQTIFNISKALKIDPAELIKQVASQTHALLQNVNNGSD